MCCHVDQVSLIGGHTKSILALWTWRFIVKFAPGYCMEMASLHVAVKASL